RDQVLDVAAIERGYEGFSQGSHHFARDLVCLVLALGDLAAQANHVIAALEQFTERSSSGKRDLSMAREKIEEPLLFRHQGPEPPQHERLARIVATASARYCTDLRPSPICGVRYRAARSRSSAWRSHFASSAA